MSMTYAQLVQLKQEHGAWRLLGADHAPLILYFLDRAFIRPNVRALSQSRLVELLEEDLGVLRQQHDRFPLSAQHYLDQWANGNSAFLRKYYPPQSDEPEFEPLPAAEKAVEFVRGLEQTPFVGTESRLLTVVQLLRDVVQATETDPTARLAELQRRRDAIDREIARVEQGDFESASPTQVRERYLQAEETARRLLADFRQVEENFRALDRQTRERIATSSLGKGELLDAIFGEQDAIARSDQGQSFRAFWSFLMSPTRQDELEMLVRRVSSLPQIQGLAHSDMLDRIGDRLVEAGEKVQRTSAVLVEQLRKYLDERVWIENKRLMALIQEIERLAVEVRQAPPSQDDFFSLPEIGCDVSLPMSRTLFRPPERPVLETEDLTAGLAEGDPEALFVRRGVDEALLRDRIRRALATRSPCSLGEVLETYPLERGLGELVAYLQLATRAEAEERVLIDRSATQTLSWQTADGLRTATLPLVLFLR